MSKIGVGVGEDFPVDDGDGNTAAGAQGAVPNDDRAEFEAWKRARDDERRYREEKRRHHEEWHQRKREFKERIKAAAREFGDDTRDRWHDRDWDGRHWHASRYWPIGIGFALLVIAIPIFILAFFFSLISAAFKAPFVILAIVAIAALVFASRHRHGHRRYDYSDRRSRYRYYDDSDIQTPPRPQPPAAAAPIITPPPATGS
jgi:hypothetical protein